MQAFAAVCRQFARTLWADTELMDHPPNVTESVPAPMSRIAVQILNEAPVVERMTSWEFHTCMNPHFSTAATKKLYNDYVAWLNS